MTEVMEKTHNARGLRVTKENHDRNVDEHRASSKVTLRSLANQCVLAGHDMQYAEIDADLLAVIKTRLRSIEQELLWMVPLIPDHLASE